MASYEGLMREWEADWKLAVRAESTIRNYVYVYVLQGLLLQHSDDGQVRARGV